MKIHTRLFALLAATVMPGLASGQVLWNTANGNLGVSTNWDPDTALSAAAESRSISNGGTATVDNGNDYTISSSPFYVGNSAGAGTLSLNGNGRLTVTGGNNMSIGQSGSGGAGTVILNGTSQLTTGGLFIGHRTGGSLTVNSGTTVSSSMFNISTGSSGGQGTVNLYGTAILSNSSDTSIRLGVNDHNTQTTLNIHSGASLTTNGGLTTGNTNGTHAINVYGSDSTISLAKALTANSARTTFSFLADEDGVSTITSQSVSIDGAALRLNIDDYVGSSNLVLFSGSLANPTDRFGSITWLGNIQGTLAYDLNSIYVVIPEPSTLTFLGLGLLMLSTTTRRRKPRASFV